MAADANPFARVQTGDIVRLPPFAFKMAEESTATDGPQEPTDFASGFRKADSPPLPPMIGTDGYLWAFNKPAGLPTHPGTGHETTSARGWPHILPMLPSSLCLCTG